MAKIDFDSDGAPFSGAVLPTIEDVAALATDDGKEEIPPKSRLGEGGARKAQITLLPASLVLGALMLGTLHFFRGAEDDGGVEYAQIPATEAKDIRVIQARPSEDALQFARAVFKDTGRQVVFFVDKDAEKPEVTEGVVFYQVPAENLPSDGVLLDGYRWYPLDP